MGKKLFHILGEMRATKRRGRSGNIARNFREHHPDPPKYVLEVGLWNGREFEWRHLWFATREMALELKRSATENHALLIKRGLAKVRLRKISERRARKQLTFIPSYEGREARLNRRPTMRKKRAFWLERDASQPNVMRMANTRRRRGTRIR